MDPSKINLSNVTKLFEYEKISREIEQCDDVETLKNIAKSYIGKYDLDEYDIKVEGLVSGIEKCYSSYLTI